MRRRRLRLFVHRYNLRVFQRDLYLVRVHCQTGIRCVTSQHTTRHKCLLTIGLEAQAWQKKACQAPIRDNAPTNRRTGQALFIIATLVVLLRFLARRFFQNTNIGWDDWFILLAWIGLIPSTAIVQVMTHHGMGKDIWTINPDDLTVMLKLFYIEQWIYQLVIIATKISIVFLYLRIFPSNTSRKFAYISWAIIAGLLAYLVGFWVYYAVECRPLSYFWHQWDGEHEGSCPGTETAIYLNSSLNIFFDILVFFLPVPQIMRLQIKDPKRKLGILLTFLVGLFVTICSIVRLRYLAAYGQLSNITYNYNDIALWSGLEGDIGVICACMPTVAGPIMYFFREKIGSKIGTKFSSNTKSSTGFSKKSLNSSSRIKRLPSTASERDVELDKRLSKHGGFQTATAVPIYNLRDQGSSDDDVELVHQKGGTGAKNQWV
jgi:hypothetical protein